MTVVHRNDFSEMAAQDRKHMHAAGTRSAINLTGRALDLSGAIRPLHKIQPVLKSRYSLLARTTFAPSFSGSRTAP